MVLGATFDIRRPTTGARHSTVGGRQLRKWRHSTFNSRLSVVGCHSAVDRRMSNVVRYSFSDATKGTLTTQENAVTTQESVGATQENAVKNAVTTQETSATTQEVAPKNDEVVPKEGGVAPKGDEVAPKNAVENGGVAVETVSAVKVAVENAVKQASPEISEIVLKKCSELYTFFREDSQRTILNAVEALGYSPRSVSNYLNLLKNAKVLEHVGPTKRGEWKFYV